MVQYIPVKGMGNESVNVVLRIKVRLNSVSSSQILSAIVYRSSHFFRKFNIRKMQICPCGHWTGFFILCICS